jgi:hypothetical protein
MPWIYSQSSGQLYDPEGQPIGPPGYSGQPPHTNDPTSEGIVNKGVTPCGRYKISAMILNTAAHGPFVLVLMPDDATRARIIALGRDPDSFRMHGERIEPPPGYASDGCIIEEHAVRVEVWNEHEEDDLLDVVAQVAA